MKLPEVLLDTDILSALMRKHPVALVNARQYLTVHRKLTFSIITRYEILRGLKAKRATTQATVFEHLCQISHVLPIDDLTIVRASDIYSDLHQRGVLISDADILIAASAMVRDIEVITNNEAHFSRIPQLRIRNWLQP